MIYNRSKADHHGSREEGPKVAEISASGLPCRFMDGVPMPIASDAERRATLAVKRLCDIAFAGMAFLALLPLLFVLGLLIRLYGPGPALLALPRIGRGGRTIRVLKFRTFARDEGAPAGERAAALGRLLRCTGMAELPQLYNVLVGDMAIIGPEAHPPDLAEADLPKGDPLPCYALRHGMRPGLTGWAQVNGLEGSVGDPARERMRALHDIAYAQNLSLALDLRILARALRAESRSDPAG